MIYTLTDLYTVAEPWLLMAVLHMDEPYAWLELCSAACAMLGSLVLALKGKNCGRGWVLFAMSNAGWIVFANGYGHWFLLLQQIVFSITSGIGIYRYLVKPPAEAVLIWRIPAGPTNNGLWRLTQTARVAAIWQEQGRRVQALTAAGDWQ
jgi:hypothetical protein